MRQDQDTWTKHATVKRPRHTIIDSPVWQVPFFVQCQYLGHYSIFQAYELSATYGMTRKPTSACT